MMLRSGNYWWPDAGRIAADVTLRDVQYHFPAVYDYMNRFGVAVQAGGNVGVYPWFLSKRFDEVFTFEPETENYKCMVLNLNQPNIHMRSCALGDHIGMASLQVNLANTGAHKIGQTGQAVEMITIDSLGLGLCDLIWLDIEGYEPEALRGAIKTLAAFRPVVIVEDKGLERGGRDATRRMLEMDGYRMAARIGRDYVMVPN